MKILVCISHVPDTTTKITFTNNHTELNTSGVQFIINPYDEIALSRALEITKDGAAGIVTVINVGDASTEPTLRKALAIGATDAVRINAFPKEAYFVAKQIADFAKNENYDLILAGKESIDFNGSEVPEMIAEFLNLPCIPFVKMLDVTENTASLEREIEGGKESITCPLPLVATASEGMAEPKIPNMRGIMSARTKPLKVVEATETNTLTAVISYQTPKPRSTVKLVEADQVEKLVELLHSEAKII